MPAFAAVQVATKQRSVWLHKNITASQSLTDSSTETVIGPPPHRQDHELSDNPYRLQENGAAAAFASLDPQPSKISRIVPALARC